MTDDQFSKAFKDIVPDSPSPDGWADGALRKRRNRAGIVGGTVGVLAVALAIPVALNLSTTQMTANPESQDAGASSEPNPAENAPEDTDGVAPVPVGDGLLGAAACFDGAGERVQPGEDEPELSDGPVRAWLCGDATMSNPFGTVGPLEPLEEGVDQIVEFVEAQPELDLATISCTMEYSLSYLVVLEYADGSVAHVTGETHGCQTITHGTTARSGGVEFLDHMVDLWGAQREAVGDPTGDPGTPACPAPNVMVVPRLDQVVAGVLCVGDTSGAYDRAELDPEDVALIVEDIQANAVEGEVGGWETSLVLVSAWGDWLKLMQSEDGASYSFVDADGVTWVWTPSPEVGDILAAVGADLPSNPISPDETITDPGMPVDPDPTNETFEPDGTVDN